MPYLRRGQQNARIFVELDLSLFHYGRVDCLRTIISRKRCCGLNCSDCNSVAGLEGDNSSRDWFLCRARYDFERWARVLGSWKERERKKNTGMVRPKIFA